ncbi:hypothetical protein EMN47_05125 [Prolixibacteraceae bacterium JC049]|nr:hypothetical protein [Prolixibacteraceae bacterium JC049]
MMNRIIYSLLGIGVMGYGIYSWLVAKTFPLVFGLASVGLGIYLFFRAFEDKFEQRTSNIVKLIMVVILGVLFGIHFFNKV